MHKFAKISNEKKYIIHNWQEYTADKKSSFFVGDDAQGATYQ